VVDLDGIGAEKLAWIMDLKNNRRGRIREYAEHFKNVKFLPHQKPWGLKCDLAFPSATQNEIDADDAKGLLANGCTCVSEGANMPTTPDGVDIFLEAKILYGPGKAANAGGVAVSGLEMCQNAGVMHWPKEEVDNRLRQIMKSIHENCVKYGKNCESVNYVRGANIAGFVKVADAMVQQGVV
jgi:glutamate dehydrogenase/leucine dehydrogenase